MPTFDCLGDPVRRRILGPRIGGELAACEVGVVAQESSESVSRGWTETSAGVANHGLPAGRVLSTRKPTLACDRGRLCWCQISRMAELSHRVSGDISDSGCPIGQIAVELAEFDVEPDQLGG